MRVRVRVCVCVCVCVCGVCVRRGGWWCVLERERDNEFNNRPEATQMGVYMKCVLECACVCRCVERGSWCVC